MALEIKIKGNFLALTDSVTHDQRARVPRNLVRHNRDKDDIFWFTNNSPYASGYGIPDQNILGKENLQKIGEPIESVAATQFPFAEIIDERTGIAFVSADALDDYLCDNLGNLNTIVPDQGIEELYDNHRGTIGIGSGWADTGLIGDLPALLFSGTFTEKGVYDFYILQRLLLTDVNPQVAFTVYSIGIPVITTGDDVRWQLEARYVADNEQPTKAADETILFTQTLPNLAANTRQPNLVFTLNKALMANQDDVIFTLSRIGGDVLDTYAGDIGVGQSGFIAETLTHNP